ncbi:phytanoyl-CoA dioxygenase family protein [Roseobacter sp. CCS2]|uniref:phytanoyl-CoA dioxygenase family protein n=1 Tax=Roseobacter sp. CCS2 TaxID=391593 RepID=UPI0000F40127|nr:phytanoyl-CoA dioxygenase family protein [Roseobacter sp. CCS2]EBA13970.1 hypothetical protein RCCS2_08774 [Roseobacter sp. CCS2]
MGKLSRVKQIVTDKRWWSFYLQRRITTPARRAWIADQFVRFKPKAAIVDNKRGDEGLMNLRNDGIHLLGSLLSAAQCEELREYFSNREVRDPYRAGEGPFLPLSDQRPKEAHIAHHDADDIIVAPYLLDIANDPRILDVVGKFLGCKPTIGYMATWWSYPTPLGPQQAENYHRDVDDWRFVKLFIYLTDVSEESGPHKYVLGSSSQPKLTDIRRFNDDEVSDTFGAQKIKTMLSAAGDGFLEDTYGIHKGQPVKNGHRLLFQVVYTLTPLPYGPKSPVMQRDNDKNHDAWTNRVYLK